MIRSTPTIVVVCMVLGATSCTQTHMVSISSTKWSPIYELFLQSFRLPDLVASVFLIGKIPHNKGFPLSGWRLDGMGWDGMGWDVSLPHLSLGHYLLYLKYCSKCTMYMHLNSEGSSNLWPSSELWERHMPLKNKIIISFLLISNIYDINKSTTSKYRSSSNRFSKVLWPCQPFFRVCERESYDARKLLIHLCTSLVEKYMVHQ